jgi:hypothetical protein
MGSFCCTDTSSLKTDLNLPERSVDDNVEKDPKPIKRKVAIRRTVQDVEIGLEDDDVEARHGAAEPDLDKLYSEAAARQKKKEAKETKRASLSENKPEEIKGHPEAEPVVGAKRSKDRKGTGFVRKEQLPQADDEPTVTYQEDEDAADSSNTGGGKRSKDRKGTGFVKKGALPVDDDEDEDDDEAAAPDTKGGSSNMKRTKDRRCTGVVKGVIPVDDDDEDED